MPDQHGCFTENEIHVQHRIKDAILREYDKWVRLHGTEHARNGLRKALDEILREREREAVGRHFWEGR